MQKDSLIKAEEMYNAEACPVNTGTTVRKLLFITLQCWFMALIFLAKKMALVSAELISRS